MTGMGSFAISRSEVLEAVPKHKPVTTKTVGGILFFIPLYPFAFGDSQSA